MRSEESNKELLLTTVTTCVKQLIIRSWTLLMRSDIEARQTLKFYNYMNTQPILEKHRSPGLHTHLIDREQLPSDTWHIVKLGSGYGTFTSKIWSYLSRSSGNVPFAPQPLAPELAFILLHKFSTARRARVSKLLFEYLAADISHGTG